MRTRRARAAQVDNPAGLPYVPEITAPMVVDVFERLRGSSLRDGARLMREGQREFEAYWMPEERK